MSSESQGKNTLILVILGAVLAAVIALSVFFGIRYYKAQKLLASSSDELNKANLALGRSQAMLGDARIQINKLNKQIQEDIKARDALLVTIAELKGELNDSKENVQIVTRVVYRDKEVPLPPNILFVKTEDGKYEPVTSLTFNYKDFRLTIEGDVIKKVLTYKLHQKFTGVFAQTIRPDGKKDHYFELHELNEKNEVVATLKLTDFKTIYEDNLAAKFHWFNPKLDLQIASSLSTDPSISWLIDGGVSFMSYGITKDDLTWRFLRIAAGANRFGFTTSFSPVQYNLGRLLPLISNLWLTPSVGYDFASKTTIFSLGLGVSF